MELVQQIAVTKSGQHSDVVTAVARASAKLMVEHFDDPRVQAWLSGRFTKTVRNGSAAKVDALMESVTPNATSGIGHFDDKGDPLPLNVRAVAFLPMTRDELPPKLSKLRVADFERPRDDCWRRDGTGPTLLINSDMIEMSTGKTAAQVAHGLCAWLLHRSRADQLAWMAEGCPMNIDEPGMAEFARAIPRSTVVIKDAGLTEVRPGSVTVIAR